MKISLLSLVLVLLFAGCTVATETPTQVPVQPSSGPEIMVQGEMVEASADGLVIEANDYGRVNLLIDEDTSVWDGIEWVAEMPAQPGDHVVAYGVWEGDDLATLATEKVYINIENLQGTVREVNGEDSQFILDDGHIGEVVIQVNPNTQIFQGEQLAPVAFKDGGGLPSVGDYVEVIGREMDDGTVMAVNFVIP